MTDPTQPAWWYDQVEVVLTLALGVASSIYAVGRWVGRLTVKVEEGFSRNHEDHVNIIGKLDDHGDRLSRVETKVEHLDERCE